MIITAGMTPIDLRECGDSQGTDSIPGSNMMKSQNTNNK